MGDNQQVVRINQPMNNIQNVNNQQIINKVIEEVKKVVIGKEEVIKLVMTSILAKGNILLEDIPGVGKTTMAMAFSKAMALRANRMQFTPDVLPSDVVGFNIINKDGTYKYKAGAVVCNLFLADEINRTSPKTQSALLEVMEEKKITVDGVTRQLEEPFIVMATQNPVGSAGTQALPESQLDRFMVKLSVGYPDVSSEVEMLKNKQSNQALENVNKVMTREQLIHIQNIVSNTFVHDSILEYAAKISSQSRSNKYVKLGISPRGTIALISMAKAYAFLNNRDYVIPTDLRQISKSVMGHRIVLNSNARVNKISVEDVIVDIINEVQSPDVFD